MGVVPFRTVAAGHRPLRLVEPTAKAFVDFLAAHGSTEDWRSWWGETDILGEDLYGLYADLCEQASLQPLTIIRWSKAMKAAGARSYKVLRWIDGKRRRPTAWALPTGVAARMAA